MAAEQRGGIAGGFLGFLLFIGIAGLIGGSLITNMTAQDAGTGSLSEMQLGVMWLVGLAFSITGIIAIVALPVVAIIWLFQRVRRRHV